ncbi:MAG: glycosyltransferase [Desulfobulbaceae bacterium]|nr:glycosyltransferase [Desulfobulbaceae bacterium]
MDIEPDLSVCVVARNRETSIGEFLSSLYATADPAAVQVIVVDNDSTDNTVKIIADTFPETIIYENGRQEPAAQAKNRVFQLARGRYLSFWEPDMIFSPGCIHRLVNFLDNNPTTGIAGPKITDPAGMIDYSARSTPTLFSLICTETALGRMFPGSFRRNRHLLASWDHNSTREVDWLTGAIVIRRETAEELGQFDEFLSSGYEDAEYCLRARRYGWHVHYIHDAGVVRTRSPDCSENLGRGLRFLIKKWFSCNSRLTLKNFL